MAQVDVKIYITNYCPYCVWAKRLLDNKGVSYTTIDVSGNDDLRMDLVKKSGGRQTVPQIFINDVPIGGYDDMLELEKSGKLDELLGLKSS